MYDKKYENPTIVKAFNLWHIFRHSVQNAGLYISQLRQNGYPMARWNAREFLNDVML